MSNIPLNVKLHIILFAVIAILMAAQEVSMDNFGRWVGVAVIASVIISLGTFLYRKNIGSIVLRGENYSSIIIWNADLFRKMISTDERGLTIRVPKEFSIQRAEIIIGSHDPLNACKLEENRFSYETIINGRNLSVILDNLPPRSYVELRIYAVRKEAEAERIQVQALQKAERTRIQVLQEAERTQMEALQKAEQEKAQARIAELKAFYELIGVEHLVPEPKMPTAKISADTNADTVAAADTDAVCTTGDFNASVLLREKNHIFTVCEFRKIVSRNNRIFSTIACIAVFASFTILCFPMNDLIAVLAVLLLVIAFINIILVRMYEEPPRFIRKAFNKFRSD